MGYTSYSNDSRMERAVSHGYYTHSVDQVLASKSLQVAMDPKGVTLRESRDSQAHPNSVAIIVALDVTGSMMSVPQEMVRDGLPTIMSTIMQSGEPDPQILFLGIGDHECDKAPLQIGQFESGDEELDKWLTSIYLERGGGGNDGESYLLAWYAATLTSIDCLEKRGKKGFLFTIGDEPCLTHIEAGSLRKIFGDGQYDSYNAKQLLAKAREKYNVYHIHTTETGVGKRPDTISRWESLIGSENLIVVQNHSEIPQRIAEIVSQATTQSTIENTQDNVDKDVKDTNSLDDIQML